MRPPFAARKTICIGNHSAAPRTAVVRAENSAPVAQARGDARDHAGEAEARDEADDGAQARVEQPLVAEM